MPASHLSAKVYAKGYVYRLIDITSNETIYIGSTFSPLSHRMRQHKSACTKEGCKTYNLAIYQKIRATCGFENVKMVLISEHEQLTKRELLKHEQKMIEERDFEKLANQVRAYRTPEQKIETNKVSFAKWLHENKELNRERVATWRSANKDRHQCIICEFASYQPSGLRKHLATKKHARNLAAEMARLAEALPEDEPSEEGEDGETYYDTATTCTASVSTEEAVEPHES